MERFFPDHILRFLLRLFFAGATYLWITVGHRTVNVVGLQVLLLLFLMYAVTILVWEQGWRGVRKEMAAFVYADIFFVGVLIAYTGGAQSEMHLLLYFMVAMRAPYRSWAQAFVIPGVATVVDIAAMGSSYRETHWFDFLVRLILLWFLAFVLRMIGLQSVKEKQRSEKLARELTSTHQDVRKYTAALEKANAEKEKRLAEITLLHRFVVEVRGHHDYEPVYEAVLANVHSVCEPAWLFLLHRPKPENGELVIRFQGDPPEHVRQWVVEKGLDPGCGSDGERTTERFGQSGDVEFRYFVRCQANQSSATLVLAFPLREAILLEEQVEILSAFMDSVEMELELLRLRRDLAGTNRKLSESNHHLTKLHELQHQLSTAFLLHRDVSRVIQGAQEIMARELLELDRFNLFIPDDDNRFLACRTSVGIGEYPLEKIRVPVDERGGAISLAYREGRTIFFDGTGPLPEKYRLADPYSRIPAIRSRIFVIVPLIDYRGKIIGVIGADRKHTHKPIPPETVTLLEYFAHHVALVLSISRLNQSGSP